MPDATPEERDLFDDISKTAAALWEKSKHIEGLNTDPKMFSVMLFKRLWSNHRGYALLWKSHFHLEGDIILRSGIEASICIAANFVLRETFVALMRRDAAATLLGQIKMHREAGEADLVREGEATLRFLQAGLPAGAKPARLNWKTLAEDGRVSHLYGWHRMLSGLSSHVTGVSVLTGVTLPGGPSPHEKLRELQRKMHLMMMAGATLHGSMHHAGMIEDEEEVRKALSLLARLDEVSMKWPGARGLG